MAGNRSRRRPPVPMLSTIAELWRKRRPGPSGPFEEGVSAIEAGRYREAYHLLTRALHEPGASSAQAAAIYNKRGVALVQQGRHEEALADFTAAIGSDPACTSAIVNVGNLALERGDVEAAIVQYEAALRIDRECALAHHNLGTAYRMIGRRKESVVHLKTADKIRSRTWFVRLRDRTPR
ncbi:tetratricopeptide repeat protein [bacterium]|nr:MAG: tetratricopeptide repeat protein [bacterium]